MPHIVYGENNSGVGRGKGEKGDIIGDDGKQSGKGKAGQGESEGITIQLNLEDVLKFMQNDLELPNLKPKENGTFEEIRIKYNSISLNGINALRHTRRTMFQALKRLCSTGEINNLYQVPGIKDPVKLITPINSDKRFRQYKEIKVESSNALVIYARDGSGSMDEDKCNIVSDMCWWIDCWIKKFYTKTERLFLWHDIAAHEVDEEKFYNYRFGGGTTCSSVFKLAAKQFEDRYPPQKWNIYMFYFTDGENWNDDSNVLIESINNNFKEHDVNLLGVTQIYSMDKSSNVKISLDNAINDGKIKNVNLKTFDIVSENGMSDSDRNSQILDAIKHLMGAKSE